jgi:hypothetical protein
MLTLKQVQDICMMGIGGDQCRFLAEDDSNGKFYCLKKDIQRRAAIDVEVKEFIKKHNDRGVDPNLMGVPLGDNCSGYTFLKHVPQGYDIKK